MSSPVWNCRVKPQNISMFYNLDLKEWIIANMAMDMDGSSRGDPGQASCAGIFRNTDTGWIYGYARCLIYAKAIETEVATIREGLEIAWEKRFRRIEPETNSQAAANLMENPPKCHPTLTHPIRRIKKLLNREWQVHI
ncbi:hypothetical protein AHAS_Ahas09G0260200 [Arachis hypogaea]